MNKLQMTVAFAVVAVVSVSFVVAQNNMKTTRSGLKYIDHMVGKGEEAKTGRTVSVHYTGWLYNDNERGAKFDSSVDRGKAYEFALGSGKVIKGLDEGVLGMKEGGKRELFVPADLGYGNQPRGSVIPANSTLNFEVELLKILPKPTLQSLDLKVGTGAMATIGATILVNYTGWLYVDGKRGKMFDTTIGGVPFEFTIGETQMIRGWRDGVLGMRVGGKRELIIPPDFAYGARGVPPDIPPNSTLNFEIELLRVTR